MNKSGVNNTTKVWYDRTFANKPEETQLSAYPGWLHNSLLISMTGP